MSDSATPEPVPPPRRLASRVVVGAPRTWTAGWQLERRSEAVAAGWFRMVAIAVGIGIGAAIVPFTVDSPGDAYGMVWRATFGSSTGLGNVLTLSATLMLTGFAAAVPYRMGLWNIGAEGQLFLGAWAAAGIAFSLSELSTAFLVPLMLVGALLAGALWILVPALARAHLHVNEIITTLLLNFVGFLWMAYWVTGPWREASSQGGISSRSIPEQAELAVVDLGSAHVHWGLFLAVVLAVVLWLVFRTTTFGYEVQVLGSSAKAGTYAGMPNNRRLVIVMLVGGGMAGLAGAVEMMGNIHRYSDTLSNNTGYSGIVVAVLAGGSELGVVVMAVVFSGLLAAGNALRVAGLSSNAAFALMGLILLLAAVANGLARYRIVRVAGRGSGDAAKEIADDG